jgi:ComF family protein
LKYHGDIALGDVLARPLISILWSLRWSFDLVVPTPIGQSRKRERGYNQAALLARPIAFYYEKMFAPQALQKKHDTRSQVGLTYDQRWMNVQDAFVADRGVVQGKQVLLVDDVTTSGATLNYCAQALIDAGAEKAYCLTLARAL